MNYYIDAQIANIKVMVKTFEQSCIMAARKDDGSISPDEAKTLKRISAATEKFLKELNKI